MRLKLNERKKLGLYFHIPFCVSKCAYCDFNSAPASSPAIVKKYVDALIVHMESYRKAAGAYQVDTVFIGGGTPTSIPTKELTRLIRAIKKNFRISRGAEFSIEANPATVTYPTLRKLRSLGVNRISFGLQSAHENELKLLSRKHSRKDFVRSFRMAREAGFDNINVDLMFGIPEQTMESLMHTIRYVTSFAPEHISLYDLKIEPGTKFYREYNNIRHLLPDEDTEADMYEEAIKLLKKYGYGQYEISNFARRGRECRHNLKYWNCEEYLGFGVSAHSYFSGNRFSLIDGLEDYINGVTVKESNIQITKDCETVAERERMGEYIMLRLRLCDGIDGREFARRFGFSFDMVYGRKCFRFIKNGYMTAENGTYSLTPAGMFISNYILSDILEFEDFGKYYFGG